MNNNIIYQDVENLIPKITLEKIKGKTWLITGASGLIGTYLLYALEVMHKRSNGPSKIYACIHSEIPEHLKELSGASCVEFIPLRNSADILNFPNADVIIHAAGYGQPRVFLKNKLECLKINSLGTLALLEKLNPKGTFLFVSSASVYMGRDGLLTENTIGSVNTDHPRNCYIEGKRFGETVCNIIKESDIDAKSIRLSFTYGPGVKKGDARVIYEFIEKGLKGQIDLLDAGLARHAYCYILDALEMIFTIVNSGKSTIYNVAGTSVATIYEIAEILGKMLGVSVKRGIENGIPGANQEEASVSIQKYMNEFGKKEFIPLEEGLLRTINWYKQYYI